MSTTTSFNPYDGQPVSVVPDSTPEAVQQKVADAVATAAEVAATSPQVRRGWLNAIADSLEGHLDELVAMADLETGLGAARLSAELSRTAGQLRFYGDVAAEGSYLAVAIDEASATTPLLVRLNQPLGPVAIFGASNFPFAFSVLGNDTGSALAAGCPVVVKAHPAHAGLSVRLAELAEDALRRAGAPDGAFALISGHHAGVCLVQAEEVAAVAFTGSQSGGLALWRLANERERPVPVYAEMGTVNPVVVTPDATARLDEVARGFVGSFTLGAGQYCTKPGLMLVPAGHDAAARVGAALTTAAPSPLMLTESIAASVEHGLADLVAAGATVVTTLRGAQAGWSAPAAVLSAPVSALVEGSRLLEECFGAVALVVEYADDHDLHAALLALQASLTATVVAGDDSDPDAPRLVDLLSRKVGRVTVGDWPTGVAYTWAQHHGGPWPATSDARATSVGAAALDRFVRPVTYQSTPDGWLPPAGRSDNPWNVPRRVNGVLDAGARAQPS
ncbi:aldehyde dehydrogenase family protein [Angustibacter sp. Root456]|uniref:aldehyde dehydrogenase family protein n=1 Tax=Angustibacter sp. Root456 TaxID=1736539 RepID=UPI0006FED1C3|nr:aldehyde dehydrogenase family protein [Angustibacter sp. Root456]KQX62699.1 aldehyde dehydrogenase [Angustibacter sp. Root456]